MTSGILLAVIFGIFLIGAIFIVLGRRRGAEGLELLQNQIHEIMRMMDTRLGESTKMMQSQFSESTRIIRDVTERLTKLDETNKQVVNFADQLARLQDILKNPKQRGVFGEYFLETLLSRAFQPNQYQMQYSLGINDKTGKELIVDAALFFGDKIIPIDSKFSLENYNRIVEERDSAERERLEKLFKQDLKERIDETAKYIRPEKGTMEFAFMFIPAEGIYYDLLVNKVGAIKVNTRDLLDYAAYDKKVHIVSPTTFYVTLQSLMVGMRAYTIQESTKQIIKNIGVLGNHLRAYQDYFLRLGNNLNTTVSAYNLAHKELGKIDKDVLRIGGESIGVEPVALDRPDIND